MTIPGYAGCLWPVDPACFSDEWEATDDAVKNRSLALASATLHRLTGQRVTACPITVRPSVNGSCFVPFHDGYGYGPFVPGLNRSGNWVNNCGTCYDPTTSVRLPRPVGRVVEVKVNGSVVDPSMYRLFEGNRLAYIGVVGGWPVAQDVALADTEVGTFAVTYINGYLPDSLAAYAAGLLANEFAKACTGKKCKLPTGVTSIVRQGVAMEITTGSFPEGVTGIREVDAFIALWNPENQRQASTVWFPGGGVSW